MPMPSTAAAAATYCLITCILRPARPKNLPFVFSFKGDTNPGGISFWRFRHIDTQRVADSKMVHEKSHQASIAVSIIVD